MTCFTAVLLIETVLNAAFCVGHLLQPGASMCLQLHNARQLFKGGNSCVIWQRCKTHELLFCSMCRTIRWPIKCSLASAVKACLCFKQRWEANLDTAWGRKQPGWLDGGYPSLDLLPAQQRRHHEVHQVHTSFAPVAQHFLPAQLCSAQKKKTMSMLSGVKAGVSVPKNTDNHAVTPARVAVVYQQSMARPLLVYEGSARQYCFGCCSFCTSQDMSCNALGAL